VVIVRITGGSSDLRVIRCLRRRCFTTKKWCFGYVDLLRLHNKVATV